MTVDVDHQADPRIRIAKKDAVCAAPGCLHLITPGQRIVKRPGGRAARARRYGMTSRRNTRTLDPWSARGE